MTQNRKRAVVEGDRKDRISSLPRNVMDNILELLPVQDGARTSILSQKWRYIWAKLPNLVLSHDFCSKLIEESESNFKEAVDSILLLHMGDITGFLLDTSGVSLSSYAAIDRWMLYVTRKGVEKLTLRIPVDNPYRLPSSIFNCSTLTHLTLSNCVFKPPMSFFGFQNLNTLSLSFSIFVPTRSFCVIKAPLLACLTLNSCCGTQYLNIISPPKLEFLYIHNSHYYPLQNCFMNCKNLREFVLVFNGEVNARKHNEKSTLEKLLVSSRALEVLRLDSFFVELLSAHIVPNGRPFTLNCLWHLSLGVDFVKTGQISYALHLIKSCPNLSKLDIWVHATSDNAKAILMYLDTPSCLERALDKLEHVVIKSFRSSKAELLFVKLLLSCTPSLLKMCIVQLIDIDVDIALELMRFPRASPRAELFYSQHKDDL
ncbi:F-box/FBD/LRR-repeat protein At1g13570-like [Solanum dulcamara]|uniref:F-box/FBD/LRR-repeat protein At1g13570-like n=1 Tax=Solanum dulcamara TaxID=45834 RepID=UPI0024854562|nr:F-box/FBD/LRR-repeat protein At1g13570-like [Solanum dulcamara]